MQIFLFFSVSAGIRCIITGEILFTEVYIFAIAFPICLKLDLMDTRCGYYGVVLDSPDEGQISFMNVTAETDRSAHLSPRADSANAKTKKTTPKKPACTPVSTNVRNTSEQCSV